jgi:hypothetical protein
MLQGPGSNGFWANGLKMTLYNNGTIEIGPQCVEICIHIHIRINIWGRGLELNRLERPEQFTHGLYALKLDCPMANCGPSEDATCSENLVLSQTAAFKGAVGGKSYSSGHSHIPGVSSVILSTLPLFHCFSGHLRQQHTTPVLQL